MAPEDKNLQIFTDSFNLEHLIKKPTCRIEKHISKKYAH